ncbi:hypothetical protein N656DRAFT_602825 [Canariomyces notabilis]|uniref:Uncharacterized protein n=1 Tax=Canariomyces notabilis TaxID=2074819 RepID=A0AAN6YTU2_9PEZI|nr:hypothetical protein N656DRAFT_602825 [Canariomyces arenarius]
MSEGWVASLSALSMASNCSSCIKKGRDCVGLLLPIRETRRPDKAGLAGGASAGRRRSGFRRKRCVGRAKTGFHRLQRSAQGDRIAMRVKRTKRKVNYGLYVAVNRSIGHKFPFMPSKCLGR